MNYYELKAAALPDLAAIALNAAANITARIAAYEAIESRVSEVTRLWTLYTDSERAALRAAFAIDAETMAARGFVLADARRAESKRKHFGTESDIIKRAEIVAALCA